MLRLTNFPGEAVVATSIGSGAVFALAFGVFVKADMFLIFCAFGVATAVALVASYAIELREETGGEG